MGVPRQAMRLSASALATVLRASRIGEPHITLAETAMWYPPEQRGEIDAQAWAEFAQQGLSGREGRLRETTLDWLPALSQPAVQYYGWITVQGQTTAYLLAPAGSDAVLAARHGETVRVMGTDHAGLAETLIAQLPPAATPRATSLNVHRSDLPAHGGTTGGIMVGNRNGSGDARRFMRMAAQPTTGLGELYVAIRDRLGRRHAVTEPLRYRDIAGQRWMLRVDGDYISLIPATPALFAEHLYQAQRRLSGQQQDTASPLGGTPHAVEEV